MNLGSGLLPRNGCPVSRTSISTHQALGAGCDLNSN
eukprot:CAMPEP_0172711564 /NCGR_PEP_ID=MMETSP1074-20121228/59558_1 /TAXON_ID=2916 /ORGANISM="Ceratium fusus, Strain PA161109" /LENGTH=35 /DNA_ID= /DNA_START= /DNA_END= /DNA_ORIENTATION=